MSWTLWQNNVTNKTVIMRNTRSRRSSTYMMTQRSPRFTVLRYLEALAAPRPSRCGCCRGYRPGSGTWPSPEAGPGWPAGTRTAARPGETGGQRSRGGPPGSSASGWAASGRPKPRSAAAPCRPGTRTPTLWGPPPWEDLQGRDTGQVLTLLKDFQVLR